MRTRHLISLIVAGLLCACLLQADTKATKSTAADKSTQVESAPAGEPAGSTAQKPADQPPASHDPTHADLAGDLELLTAVLIVVVVLSSTVVAYVVSSRTAGLARQDTAEAIRDALAAVGQLQAPIAAVTAAVGERPTVQALANAVQPLATTDALQAVRSDVAQLRQEVAAAKAGNDAVLNLVSRVMAGLPPQITHIERAAGAPDVVLFGNNFMDPSQVFFGTVAAAAAATAANTIRTRIPAGVTGAVNVYVLGPNGTSQPQPFTV